MYLFSPCFLTLSQLEQMWGLPYSYMNFKDYVCMLNLAEA